MFSSNRFIVEFFSAAVLTSISAIRCLCKIDKENQETNFCTKVIPKVVYFIENYSLISDYEFKIVKITKLYLKSNINQLIIWIKNLNQLIIWIKNWISWNHCCCCCCICHHLNHSLISLLLTHLYTVKNHTENKYKNKVAKNLNEWIKPWLLCGEWIWTRYGAAVNNNPQQIHD